MIQDSKFKDDIFSYSVLVAQTTCWRKEEGSGCSRDKDPYKRWQKPEHSVHKRMIL